MTAGPCKPTSLTRACDVLDERQQFRINVYERVSLRLLPQLGVQAIAGVPCARRDVYHQERVAVRAGKLWERLAATNATLFEDTAPSCAPMTIRSSPVRGKTT